MIFDLNILLLLKCHVVNGYYRAQKHCIYGHSVSGYFDFQPFQAVIAIGTLVFVHSTLFSIYYILPLDSNNNKFIPGRILSLCLAYSTRFLQLEPGLTFAVYRLVQDWARG